VKKQSLALRDYPVNEAMELAVPQGDWWRKISITLPARRRTILLDAGQSVHHGFDVPGPDHSHRVYATIDVNLLMAIQALSKPHTVLIAKMAVRIPLRL